MTERRRVIIFADTDRGEVADTLALLERGLARHIEIVDRMQVNGDPIPQEYTTADFAIAIGGDGTIISQARRIVDHDVPMIGVNVGRFGFLAEFDAEDLIKQADTVFGDRPPTREYMLLCATVRDGTGRALQTQLAVNDCVVTAGPPFRMIRLEMNIDGREGPTVNGDGVVVATPIGSTAYNVSAGGSIVHPAVEAISVTPLAPHSLAFRPIIIPPTSELVIAPAHINAGTTLVLDGQVQVPLEENMTIRIARHDRKAKLITNPATNYWQVLLEKMRWAAPPSYRDRGV